MTIPNLNTLGYTGLKEKNPPDIFFRDRDPTIKDYARYDIGDLWQNTDTRDWFILSAKPKNPATLVINAVWDPLIAFGSDVNSLTGDDGNQVDPASGNISILGSEPGFEGALEFYLGANPGEMYAQVLVDGTTIQISGNSLSIGDAIASSYPTDAGTAIPAANILNVVGGVGITTSAVGNTITIDSTPVTFTWIVDNSSPIAPLAGEGHISTTVPITYNLPGAAVVGNLFSFVQRDANNITIQAPAGQTIRIGDQVTSAGGTLVSFSVGSTVSMVCVEDGTQFLVLSSMGNWDVT